MTNELDLTAEVLDVRDLIARYEYLEDAVLSKKTSAEVDSDELAEALTLGAVLEELKGNGGDEEWRGDWYPVTLVNDSHFVDYAREMLEDCGYIPSDFPDWIAIDWDKTAEAVQQDYTLITIGSEDYWYR